MDTRSKIKLYKEIIRAAKAFPSIKKHKIVQEIRVSFRANKDLKDEKEVEKALSLAVKGLSQLSMYAGLRSTRGVSWSVQLEQNPMPVDDPQTKYEPLAEETREK
ncbi:LYR motif-containing protein [archaeon]|nr:MAG: LYR motif-containing protein [archaeon]